jgi:alpha-D-xyloside xylohydrolase
MPPSKSVEQTKDGIIKHLDIRFSGNTKAVRLQGGDRVMFAPSFLVNPVYSFKSRTHSRYFPAEQGWYDLYSGKYQSGGKNITIDAAYESIPVFIRERSIVPFGPELQYTNEKLADPITLRVYTGKDAFFSLYEDENINYNYAKGRFSNIPFTYNEAKKKLTIRKRKGSFSGMLTNRTFDIV